MRLVIEEIFVRLDIKERKCDKKKKLRNHGKDDLSDPSSINDSDSSNGSGYRCKRHKKEESSGKQSNQMMRTFNGKYAGDSV